MTWVPPMKKHIWHWAEIPEDPKVKELMPEINLQYVITEHTVPDNKTACWNHSIFPPGSQHHKHMHKYADEVAYVVRGRCVVGVTIDGVDVEFVVGPGTAVWAKRGQPHWHRNPFNEPVEFVGAYFGVPSVEKSGYVDLKEK